MTIEVTQEDRDLVMAIAMLVNDTGITIPERLRSAEDLCARHRIEAQRPLLELLDACKAVAASSMRNEAYDLCVAAIAKVKEE